MPVRSYVQIVNPYTCLGDSLITFNSNFSALDDGINRQPTVIGEKGTVARNYYTEQGYPIVSVAARNSFTHGANFDYIFQAQKTTIPLADGTQIPVVSFPYTTDLNLPDNIATFSTVSLTNSPPVVTVYWTASGTDLSTTVYATNSATSALDIGTLGFNGSINSIHASANILYVGGSFTAVGSNSIRKLCIVNLDNGVSVGTRGYTGTLVENSPLYADGGFGPTGTINVIAEQGNFLVFGGTYQSFKGKGLTIYDKTTNTIYPFYVNGDVNSVLIHNNNLYVGGNFDYINYSYNSASVISGLRVYTNGLAKISLSLITTFPNSSIDKQFAANVLNSFTGAATINSLASKLTVIYIGGLFECRAGTSVIASNLALLNSDGSIGTSWKPVVDGPVHTLAVDGNYLYVGGAFKSIYTAVQYFGNPRPTSIVDAHNIGCFNVSLPPAPTHETNWKPKFNGRVTKLAFHDQEYSSYVYCYGDFTMVNETPANHVAAVNKSFSNQYSGETPLPWRVNVDVAPSAINQGIVRYGSSLLIGGNFNYVNGVKRSYLARISGAYEQLEGEELQSTSWKFGAQMCNPGADLSLNLTNTVSVTSYVGKYGTVNQTTFPEAYTSKVFENSTPGSLMRFFVQRPKYSGTLESDVHVLGWKVNFN